MAAHMVSNVLIEDLLCEVDPDLEVQPQAFVNDMVALLRPCLNRVVRACRTPEALSRVIERERKHVAAYLATAQAFEIFVTNISDN